jgi:hypothetical protein
MKIRDLISAGFLPDCTAKGSWENPVTGARVWACGVVPHGPDEIGHHPRCKCSLCVPR